MARVSRTTLALVFLSLWTPLASGAIGPSFDLDGCCWKATHVVVVTEGKQLDGAIKVLESWKGDLRKGDRLTLPALAKFAPPEKRTIVFWGGRAANQPGAVTGQRMILFLRRKAEQGDPTKGSLLPAAPTWKQMDVSVVWVEQGQAYAFLQFINPGPTRLSPLGLTEEKIRDRVRQFASAQSDLARAVAVSDPAKRAEALRALAGSPLYQVREAAFQQLGKAGKGALPVLRRMLGDTSLARHHGDVVQALAHAGGMAAGSDLKAIVERELAFWKKEGPNLKVGWWNGGGLNDEKCERLRNRYSVALQALRGLAEVRFDDSKKVVREFRDFWRSLPQLEDRSGLNQMSQECDRVLSRLQK
jgi:hypothetical protein